MPLHHAATTATPITYRTAAIVVVAVGVAVAVVVATVNGQGHGGGDHRGISFDIPTLPSLGHSPVMHVMGG
jgi:hypothetical protein